MKVSRIFVDEYASFTKKQRAELANLKADKRRLKAAIEEAEWIIRKLRAELVLSENDNAKLCVHSAELWNVDSELKKAGFKTWAYKTYSEQVEILRKQRDAQAAELTRFHKAFASADSLVDIYLMIDSVPLSALEEVRKVLREAVEK